MLRFSKNAEISPPEARIQNAFVRLLASETIRRGRLSLPVSLGESEFSVRARYAPMQRLLTRADENFLCRQGCPKAAAKLRREHRQCYWEFLARLRREIRQSRQLRGLAMASADEWDLWSLTSYAILSECSLLYLGWLGWRHSVGLPSAACNVTECLNFLLSGPKFALEAT